MEAVGRFGGDLAELNQLAGGHLTDQLAVCVAARIAITLRESTEARTTLPRNCAACASCVAHLVKLRKGDHEARWMQIEREKMDFSASNKRSGAEAADVIPTRKFFAKGAACNPWPAIAIYAS